nr:transposase (putative), gypsy type [Tanacetum cinerariifolium]
MVRDSVQLETAVHTITHEYLLEFTSEYGISEMLHPELPGPGDRIVDFPEGKNIVPTLSLFRVFYIPSFNLGWMSFSKRSGKNTPQCYTKPLDSLKNWNNRFFWVDECVFPPAVEWQTNASKDGMPASGTYSVEAVRALDTHRTPIQKQPEALLCLVGISRRYYLEDDVYPTFHYDDDREMGLFSLIRAPNQTKVKTGSRPRAPHELSLLTWTASRVIEMDEPAAAMDSSGVPSAIEKSPLDFADEAEASGRETAALEVPPPEEVPITTVPGGDQAAPVTVEPPTVPESRKRGREGIDANAPPKSLQRDHADLQPSGSSRQLCLASNIFMYEGVPADVSDLDPLAFADAPSPHPADVIRSSQGAAVAGDSGFENVSSPTEVGSPGSVYRPEWGVTNGSLLDAPEACQDLVDHAAPSGYFSELRHMHNEEFLGQYNINLARQVAMGSQLRLRFEQEAKLLRKSVAQVARREQRIQARESEIKNLEVSNERLSLQVDALQQQVSGEETLKAAFEDYKRQQDQMVEQRYAEMDAYLDAMSIDFDEELYPHMLTAIAGRRWVIGHGLRLATMKCVESLVMRQAFADVVSAGIAKGMSEGLKHGVEHGHAQRTIESLEAYDPEAEAKFAAALQSLKDLKLPLLDQLEGLKDAPMDVIMASLYLEDDTGDDAPQFIRDLYPSSSQLAIPVYPENRKRESVYYAELTGSAPRTMPALWARSPRPLGLQPAYAADHAPGGNIALGLRHSMFSELSFHPWTVTCRLHFPARLSPHMGLPILGQLATSCCMTSIIAAVDEISWLERHTADSRIVILRHL